MVKRKLIYRTCFFITMSLSILDSNSVTNKSVKIYVSYMFDKKTPCANVVPYNFINGAPFTHSMFLVKNFAVKGNFSLALTL